MDSRDAGEAVQTEASMVREAKASCGEREVEKKVRRLSRKKSKNRSRKRRSHSKGVSDTEADPVGADDMTEGSGERLGRQNSIPSRHQKSRSLSGSRKRLTSWFKRKSRSESRGRSKSETELNRVDQNVVKKRHESAEDIKREPMVIDKNEPKDVHNDIKRTNYEVYDITKQPRDRLKRMTVRDAVKERRQRKVSSGQSQLDRYIDTEDVHLARTASLPDISNVDPTGEDNEGKTNDNTDVIDNASSYVRGSVTLPRDKKNRLKKKKNSSKSGRVSIEADSDDNIIDDSITPSTARVKQCEPDSEKSVKNGKESPQTQIEVMVHGISGLVDKASSGNENSKLNTNANTNAESKQNSASESNSKETVAKKDDTNNSSSNKLHNKSAPKLSTPTSSKAIARWQSAIQDVQKKRRKESLSLFLELSRSPNPYSSRSASSSSLFPDKSRSVSPRGRVSTKEKCTERSKTLSPLRESGVKRENSSSNDSHDNTSGSKLGVPCHLDRSLSDGEGRTVIENSDPSVQKCHRTHSAKSEPSKKSSPNINGERNGVPVMGTSVQQKYKRTFSPKRQEKVPKRPDELETKAENNSSTETKINENSSPKERDLPSSPSESGTSASPTSPKHNDQCSPRSPSRDSEKILGDKTSDQTKTQSPDTSPKTPNKESSKDFENGDMCQILETRGRDSQRRRTRSGRSFRRKREKETEREKDSGQAEPSKESPESIPGSPVRVMYDKSTQTSVSDLSDKTKTSGKNKKNKKEKKEDKRKDKKRAKEVTSLIPEPNKEEEKRLSKSDNKPDDKSVDDKEKVIPDENEDYSKQYQIPDSPGEPPKIEDSENKDDDSKPKPKKLSFATLVILKQRLASRRKKREQEALNKKKEPEKDSFKDMFMIENEINLSRLADIKETDILDDEVIEPDVTIELPRKQIRFEPMASDEPIQGEEPLPPLSRRTKDMSGRRDSRMREKRKKCLHCCKKFTAFLFSHIGLCSLVVAYTIMGGFIFKAIEGPFEDKVKTIIKETRIKLVDKLLQHATELSLSEIGQENFTAIVNDHLKKFQSTVYKETKEHGWDGKDKTDSEVQEMQWSFASSLLYAITVMTTIGYGHVAPKTDQGRILTIGYAVLGIPLTLLCLTNIGDVMATGFRLLYGKVCCGVCCKLFSPRRRRIPDLEKGLARQVLASEEETPDKPKEVIRVPTSLCILLIAGYIFAGALLFALWEKWDYLTGSYFCFITLSTIGFGDIVPGTDLNAWSQQEKLVLCAMYLLFGLSLIAMCFNLVQEDVKAKCRWLGMKMGIIDKPESGV